MVGAMAGFVAGVVDIGADWMSDLREGVCGHQFWFNKESCCWDSSSQFGQESCDAWLTWSDVLTISKTSKVGYLHTYSIFVFWFNSGVSKIFCSICMWKWYTRGKLCDFVLCVSMCVYVCCVLASS